MRILTVRQPYAGLIAAGVKPVENRPQNIAGDYRGPVAIHSAKTLADIDWSDSPRTWGALYEAVGFRTKSDARGSIIGVVDLVGVHYSKDSLVRPGKPVCFDKRTPIGHLCSPWAQYGQFGIYHLALANPRPLPEPIPYKGALGLRELPAEVEALIWAQIGDPS